MFAFAACNGGINTDELVESASNIAEDVVESVNEEISEITDDEVDSSVTEKPHWGYSGDIGPSHWADLGAAYALCGTGGIQSPIDLPGGQPTLADVSFDYEETAVNIKNNGHAIQVDYDGDQGFQISH